MGAITAISRALFAVSAKKMLTARVFFRSYREQVRFFISDDNENLGWDGQPLTPCRLDFYCDHGAEVPLWIEGSGMAYAGSLPVGPLLRSDLRAFQVRWAEGGEDFDVGQPDYEREGRALVGRVREELPPPWLITSPWDG